MSFDVMAGFGATAAPHPLPSAQSESARPPWACPLDVSYVGIDPGQQGYLAGIGDDGREVLWAVPIPTYPTGKGRQREYDLPRVWEVVSTVPRGAFIMLEKQQVYPKQGGVSGFNTGRGYMMWEAFLTAAGLSYEVTHPRTWKGKMGIRVDSAKGSPNEKQKQAKARAIHLTKRLFPGFDLRDKRKTERSKVPCADMAEAILLAVYARRKTSGDE